MLQSPHGNAFFFLPNTTTLLWNGMTSVVPLHDTWLSAQLAFTTGCGTRNFRGSSRLSVKGYVPRPPWALSSLTLAVFWKKAMDGNLLISLYIASLPGICAALQGKDAATSWAGWLCSLVPVPGLLPGSAGSSLEGAKRRRTAELIIIFQMFQEPQKQIK